MISYDNSKTTDFGSGTVGTDSFVVGSGSNRALFVCAYSDSGDFITGITYNGVAMTLVDKLNVSGTVYIYIFKLVNPASGSHTIQVSASSSTYLFWAAVSYAGAHQSALVDGSAVKSTGNTDGSGDWTKSITTTVDNDWLLMWVNGQFTWTGQTNATMRAGNFSTRPADTNAAQTPAGSKSMTLRAATALGATGSILIAFSPAPTVGGMMQAAEI